MLDDSQESTGSPQQRRAACSRRCNGRCDIARALDVEHEKLLSGRLRRSQQVFSLSLGFRRIRIDQHRNGRRLGYELAQQPQPF